MKKVCYIAAAALLLGLAGCTKQAAKNEYINDGHTSQNSLDWAGFYTGTIPCASCEGIEVSITLNKNNTYVMHYYYIGKPNDIPSTKGTFTWSKDGSTVIFSDKTAPHFYKVGENKLIQLDMEGNPITGKLAKMYVLKKMEFSH